MKQNINIIIIIIFSFVLINATTECPSKKLEPRKSQIILNLKFIFDSINYQSIDELRMLVSLMQIRLNPSFSGPFVLLNADMMDYSRFTMTDLDTMYILISKSPRTRIETCSLITSYTFSDQRTILFSSPIILIDMSITTRNIIYLIDMIMPVFYPLIELKLNVNNIGTPENQNLALFPFDINGIAYICTLKLYKSFVSECNEKIIQNKVRTINDPKCGMLYTSCNNHSTILPEKCNHITVTKNNTCILTYQKYDIKKNLARPVIEDAHRTRIVSASTGILKYMYVLTNTATLNLLICTRGKYEYSDLLIQYAIHEVNSSILNINIKYVLSTKKCNIYIEWIPYITSSRILGVAYNSFFTTEMPRITIACTESIKQMRDTLIHELFHLFEIPHDKHGSIMAPMYVRGNKKVPLFIVNKCPSTNFPGACRKSNEFSKMQTKIYNSSRNEYAVYTNMANFITVVRLTHTILYKSYKKIDDVINQILSEVDGQLHVYNNVDDAYHQGSGSQLIYSNEFKYIGIPSITVCTNVNIQYCLLIIAIDHEGQIKYTNLGYIEDGIYKVNIKSSSSSTMNEYIVGCMGGQQIFRPVK